MSAITVSQEKCTLCGLCISECPFGLFVQEEKINVIEGAETKCINCGHCISICPVEAIALPSSVPEELIKIDKKLNVTQEEMTQFLKANRSVRQYKDTVVSREVISELMDVTSYGPSAKNIEPLHWIISENRAETRRLADFTVKSLIESKVDFLMKMAEIYEGGKEIIFRGAPHVIIAHADQKGFNPSVDCTIGLTYFDLIANSFGLGTCWAGFFMMAANNYLPLIEYLKLPEGHKVYGAMMFGYPKYEYKRIPQRHKARVRFI